MKLNSKLTPGESSQETNVKQEVAFERPPVVLRSRLHSSRIGEWCVEKLLFVAAAFSIVVTLGIVGILVFESIPFFKVVSLKDFFFDPYWTPMFADPHFGISSLLSGTLVTTFVALSVAIPVGSIIAIYLSEYASSRVRETLKPILELLSAIPTVVYGYFALLVVTPILQKIFLSVFGSELISGFSMLSAGLVMGVMIIPYVSSLSEDAMRAVPMELREASYALGSTRLQTSLGVVVPAAFSGITAAYILAISRAVGETMIVAIAAGMQPTLTLNPLEPAATITAFIVQVSLGDLPHGTIGYQSIFVAGLSLLILTLLFNLLGHWMRKKYREAY